MVVIMKEDDYTMRNFYGKFFMTYVELNIEKRFANYQILFHNHYETQQNILRFEIFWILYLISELQSVFVQNEFD